MALINDLLNRYTAGSVTDALFTIDNDTRRITVPQAERVFGVLEDLDSETKYFAMDLNPTSTIDISTAEIIVAWMVRDVAGGESKGFTTIPTTMIAKNSKAMVFGWLLPGEMFEHYGKVYFNVHFHNAGKWWHTTIASGEILEGFSIIDDSSDDLMLSDYRDALEVYG